MIKVDFGSIEYEGSKVCLMAEFTTIINQFLKEGIIDNDDLNECIKLAKKSDDELAEDTGIDKEVLKMILSKIFDNI